MEGIYPFFQLRITNMKEKTIQFYGYDNRGNIYRNALAESLWAFELLNSLSEEDQTTYKSLIQNADLEHHIRDDLTKELQDRVVPKKSDPIKQWFCYNLSNKEWIGRKAKMELNWEFDKNAEGGFTAAEEKIHNNLREDSIFSAETRGRQRVNENKRTSSVKDRDAGLVSKRYVSPDARQSKLYDFFPDAILHEKGSTIRKGVDGGVDEAFKKTGAPFIAGASGSIEYTIYDLWRAAKKDIVNENEIEKWILIMTAELILGGHHSLSEALLVAKHAAFGYFSDITDPRECYAAFLYQVSNECKKYSLYSDFSSLSEENQLYLTQKGLANLKNILLIGGLAESIPVKEIFEQMEKSQKPAFIVNKINKLQSILTKMTINRQDKRQLTMILEQALPFLEMAQDLQTLALTGQAVSMIRRIQSFP